MSDLETAIKEVETRGLWWAIEGGPTHGYVAVIQKNGNYVGDALAYAGAESSDTPAGALKAALAAHKD